MKSEYYYDGDAVCLYEYSYPNDLELLNIFPEAKDIIPLKIKEWMRERNKLERTETIPYLKKCESIKDPFSQSFWQEVYRYVSGYRKFIARNLIRLNRLQGILSDPEGAISQDRSIQAAKSIPLTDIYEFKRRGKSYLCPIHNDKDPSFHIYKDNTWYCFGCNRGGDTINFVQYLQHLDFKQSINFIIGVHDGR